MTNAESIPRELTVPGIAFPHIRRVLAKESDAETAIRVLHEAGSRTGESVFGKFSEALGDDPSSATQDHFWSELGRFLSAQGWGELTHERIHPGLGMIRSADWGECDPDSGVEAPSCAFGAGMLSRILGLVSGSPISVLEVSCRSRGDRACSFAFGSDDAVRGLRELLADSDRLDAALDRL